MSLVDKMTGKCQEEFKKWYIPYIREQRPDYLRFSDESLLRKFNRSIPSMQFGVIVDFADSVGYEIQIANLSDRLAMEVKPVNDGFRAWVNRVAFDGSGYRNKSRAYTRSKARQVAVEEFNRIYNEQNK